MKTLSNLDESLDRGDSSLIGDGEWQKLAPIYAKTDPVGLANNFSGFVEGTNLSATKKIVSELVRKKMELAYKRVGEFIKKLNNEIEDEKRQVVFSNPVDLEEDVTYEIDKDGRVFLVVKLPKLPCIVDLNTRESRIRK